LTKREIVKVRVDYGIPSTGMTEWDASGYSRISSLQAAMAQEVLALLELKGSERILDVGCGEGKITAQIASRVPKGSVVGVDPSHDMIGFAKKHFTPTMPSGSSLGNLRFEVADARCLSFKNEFDLAVSFNALHWIPEQDAALRSIRSTLVQGSKTQFRLVTAGARRSLESVVEEARAALEWKDYFKNFQDPYLRLTPDEYVAVAEQNGFRVLRVHTQDHSWDFGSRAAFASFSAIGLVAWTDRLPAAERRKFVDEVLDHYQSVAAAGAGEENTFRFYQTDIALQTT
jgi:trans-aconitate 2-methyltransferase